MTREIEIAAATIEDIRVDLDQLQVTWNLQVSKVDTQAKGVARTHGCGCGSEHQLSKICPYHTLTRHYSDTLEFYRIKFRCPEGVRSNEYFKKLPLFPDSQAKFLSKNMVIEAIRSTARNCGTEMTQRREDGSDRQLIGGHALRVAGAQFMARHGIELYMIQLMGRWGSKAVERYVQQAPLARQASVASSIHMPTQIKQSDHDKQCIPDKGQIKDSSAQENRNLREDLTALALRFMNKEDRYVINCSSECIHKPDSMEEHHPSSLWRGKMRMEIRHHGPQASQQAARLPKPMCKVLGHQPQRPDSPQHQGEQSRASSSQPRQDREQFRFRVRREHV